MLPELSPHTVEYLVHLAKLQPDREICGLILKNQTVHPIMNVAKDPRRRFEMDPIQQLEALQAFTDEKLGDKILGMYHSHPGRRISPSDVDVMGWPPEGWRYWIIAGDIVLEWEKQGNEPTLVWANRSEPQEKLAGAVSQDPAFS